MTPAGWIANREQVSREQIETFIAAAREFGTVTVTYHHGGPVEIVDSDGSVARWVEMFFQGVRTITGYTRARIGEVEVMARRR